MKSTEPITTDQGFTIINEMIHEAKLNLTSNSFYFLLWGWLMAFAGIGEYILQYVLHQRYFFIIWPIAGLLGGLSSMIYGNKNRSINGKVNFTDRAIASLWMSFVITLILIIVCAVKLHLSPNSFVMLLTGLPTFATGLMLRFKPLIWGGIVFWILGVVSFIIATEFSALLFSTAIIFGYLIPGYALKKVEMETRKASSIA